MWVGLAKPDGSIPAWVFYLINEQDVEPMQGIFTKCLIEVNSWKMLEQAAANSSGASNKSDSSDQAANDTWLESQIICDRADIDMENAEE